MAPAVRGAAAFAVAAIAATAIVRLGFAKALPLTHLAAVLAVSMLVPGLGRLARVVLSLALVTVVLAASRGRIDAAAFEPALFAFAFVLVASGRSRCGIRSSAASARP